MDPTLARYRKEIHTAVFDWMGIDLTEPQVDEILFDPIVKGELEVGGGVDTVAREAIGNFLARKIFGRRWPVYGDLQEEREKFFAEYPTRAVQVGYKLSGNATG